MVRSTLSRLPRVSKVVPGRTFSPSMDNTFQHQPVTGARRVVFLTLNLQGPQRSVGLVNTGTR